MTKKQLLHILGLAAVGVLGGIVDVFTQSHAVWAPIAVALAVDLKNILGTKLSGPPVAVLALAALVGLSGCKSVLGPVPPPNTPGFVNCSEAALHAAALNILPSAETAIAQANYEAAVAALIAGIGGPLAFAEVACALQWIASKAALQETATGDPLEATKAAHARAWLAAHPVQFQ
ncbi:MAG TPA: hypothetical protein VN697_03370 [Tepidiformaceae bacterium]|nr:hypothetical protein [Tepidiformaceae bacterium]